MAAKIISLEDITIDSKKLAGYNQSAQDALRSGKTAKEEFEDICTTVAKETGIKKTQVGAYFKARYKDDTSKTIATGTLFEVLNSALDN